MFHAFFSCYVKVSRMAHYSLTTCEIWLQMKTKGSSHCQGRKKGRMAASPSGTASQLTEIIWDCCNAKAEEQDMKLLIAFGSVNKAFENSAHVFNCV